jgi:hypothetical protein
MLQLPQERLFAFAACRIVRPNLSHAVDLQRWKQCRFQRAFRRTCSTQKPETRPRRTAVVRGKIIARNDLRSGPTTSSRRERTGVATPRRRYPQASLPPGVVTPRRRYPIASAPIPSSRRDCVEPHLDRALSRNHFTTQSLESVRSNRSLHLFKTESSFPSRR